MNAFASSDIYERIRNQDPTKVKFIRLGEKGDKFRECQQDKTIYFGFGSLKIIDVCNGMRNVSEAIEAQVRKFLIEQERPKVTDTYRQFCSFFGDAGDTLWVTEYKRIIYFGYASDEPAYVENGQTFRSMLSGWVKLDVEGKVLQRNQLSGTVTKTFAYRSTTCNFSAEAARLLINRILCTPSEMKQEAQRAYDCLRSNLENLIVKFSPQDLELLIELIIARAGLKRIGASGKVEEFLDQEFMHPITGDDYCVQIKSDTSPQEFATYCESLEIIKESKPNIKLIYAFHTGKVAEVGSIPSNVDVWDKTRISELAISYGLADWVIQVAPV